jgi:hypothetical protein
LRSLKPLQRRKKLDFALAKRGKKSSDPTSVAPDILSGAFPNIAPADQLIQRAGKSRPGK